MGTKGLLRFKEPSIYGPDLSWAGLSRALQKAIDGDGSAFAVAAAGVPQYGYHGLLGNACLDYAPQVHTYQEMQQRLELGRQLAPHLQGASETWQANFCIDWPVEPVNPPKTLNVRGVPTLIIQAVHDPSIPYSWAHGLAAQIDGSALLTHRRRPYLDLHLRLRQVSYGCVLGRTAQRGEPHLRRLDTGHFWEWTHGNNDLISRDARIPASAAAPEPLDPVDWAYSARAIGVDRPPGSQWCDP
jgi:hypothetical protein